jgi:tyrosyl-tRNA synthetase
MGGSDQWGNITAGTEFIRRNTEGKAYAMTTPLLTKSDGSKFGKSEEGNIWLDPNLTSPYRFYQFWLNADDADLPKYIRYFTLKSREEVESLEREYAGNPRELKRILAEELTRRVHSDQDYESVVLVSELLFGKTATPEDLLQLTLRDFETIAGEIPSCTLPVEEITKGMPILDFLTQTGILSSKSEARKAIQGNAVSFNKTKVSSVDLVIDEQFLLKGRYILLENGKKNKYIVRAEAHL